MVDVENPRWEGTGGGADMLGQGGVASGVEPSNGIWTLILATKRIPGFGGSCSRDSFFSESSFGFERREQRAFNAKSLAVQSD